MERRRALALAATTALIVGSGAVAAGATGALPILGFGGDEPQVTAESAPDTTGAAEPDPDPTTSATWAEPLPAATWPTPDPVYLTEYQYVDDIVVVPARRQTETPTTTAPTTTEAPTTTTAPPTTVPTEPPPSTDPPATQPPPTEPPVTTTRPRGDDHDDDDDDDGDDHGSGAGTSSVCRSLKVEDDGTVHCED